MADFTKAYKITILGNEGGYNPGIGEKETYAGVDRGANPNWSGWRTIDNVKAANNGMISAARMNMLLATNTQLQNNLAIFYEKNYWDTVKLDDVTDQQLANNLFDCSVNQGEGLARRFMQVACNELIENSGGSSVAPLIIDHLIGPDTLKAFNLLPAEQLMQQINSLREASYRQDEDFKEWGKVWLKRLVKYE